MGDANFIMISEPTEGLSLQMVQRVVKLWKYIAKRCVATLLMEQKFAISMDIAHRVFVMGYGQLVFEEISAGPRARYDVRKEWLEVWYLVFLLAENVLNFPKGFFAKKHLFP